MPAQKRRAQAGPAYKNNTNFAGSHTACWLLWEQWATSAGILLNPHLSATAQGYWKILFRSFNKSNNWGTKESCKKIQRISDLKKKTKFFIITFPKMFVKILTDLSSEECTQRYIAQLIFDCTSRLSLVGLVTTGSLLAAACRLPCTDVFDAPQQQRRVEHKATEAAAAGALGRVRRRTSCQTTGHSLCHRH